MSYNVPNVKFNDGRSIPQLGYGVWQVEDEVAEKADDVKDAIKGVAARFKKDE